MLCCCECRNGPPGLRSHPLYTQLCRFFAQDYCTRDSFCKLPTCAEAKTGPDSRLADGARARALRHFTHFGFPGPEAEPCVGMTRRANRAGQGMRLRACRSASFPSRPLPRDPGMWDPVAWSALQHHAALVVSCGPEPGNTGRPCCCRHEQPEACHCSCARPVSRPPRSS